MEKQLADALLSFYQQILKPEFDALKAKLAEHDERLSEILERQRAEAPRELDPEIRAMLERND